jgi:hypothetical protein
VDEASPAAVITGEDLPSARQLAPAVGRGERPLGPARWGYVGARELYRAILEGVPYPVRAVLGFGANMLLAHADGRYGREARQALDFYAHADLFMNPLPSWPMWWLGLRARRADDRVRGQPGRALSDQAASNRRNRADVPGHGELDEEIGQVGQHHDRDSAT